MKVFDNFDGELFLKYIGIFYMVFSLIVISGVVYSVATGNTNCHTGETK